MAPLIESFPASSLAQRVQVTTPSGRGRGRGRKEGGEEALDYRKCELLEMMQFECELGGSRKLGAGDVVIECRPVVRFFRR